LILYADTSSIVKLYLVEAGSSEVRTLILTAAQVATSAVAYTETRVALARAFRDGRLDEAGLQLARQKFEGEWPDMGVVELSDAILHEAADLGDIHPIRAFDAIHLASAKQVRSLSTDEFAFSTADRRLRDAAAAEGFSV
jgi:predicted nucleic acid-binding protein